MIELSLIHEKICIYFNVDYMFPFLRTKKTKVIYIRQLFHYLSRELNNNNIVTLNEIGNYLSDIVQPFEHGTVINSCKRIEGYLTYDKNVQKDVENIIKMLPKSQYLKEAKTC